MDGEAIFFTGRGGAGKSKAKNLWDGARKGSKLAGPGGARAGNILRVLIEIICCSKGNLNLHCIK